MQIPIFSLKKISKKYGNHIALQGIDLDLYPGEIHGLVGENGAGKSTLLGILSGHPGIGASGGYSGSMQWQGETVKIADPAMAARLGIGMVTQEFSLLPTLTIAENIQVGHENTLPWTRQFGDLLAYIDNRQDLVASQSILNKLQVQADPAWTTGNLPISLQQFVELAREISKPELKLLILDEPTAALTPKDTSHLLTIMQEIAARGVAILFVSHRLEEITACCHQVTVLRNAQIVSRYTKPELSIPKIAADMLGRINVEARRVAQHPTGELILELQDFSVVMPGERLHQLSFGVQRGEILGVSSLPGHGKSAIGCGLLGLFPTSGNAFLNRSPLFPLSQAVPNTTAMLSAGLCLIPDDRRQSGLLLNHSIEENITFTAVQQGNFLHSGWGKYIGWPSRRATRACAAEMVSRLDIRCRDIRQTVRELSGGNQQKVCLAKALTLNPEILFVHEPTRGVDIGAKEMILQSLLDFNENQGITLVLVSGELSELKRICDRIIILYEGRISGIFPANTADQTIALALAGQGGTYDA